MRPIVIHIIHGHHENSDQLLVNNQRNENWEPQYSITKILTMELISAHWREVSGCEKGGGGQ